MKALYLLVLTFLSCSFREPAAISISTFDGSSRTLNALSKKAQAAVFPLHESQRYRYELSESLFIPPSSSIAVLFNVKKPVQDGIPELIFELNSRQAFMLPVHFGFLALEGQPATICYAMPFDDSVLRDINVESKGGEAFKDSVLTMLDIRLVPRRYGYESGEDSFFVTPYVRAERRSDGKKLITLYPPEEAALERFELQLKGLRGAATAGTKKTRYQINGGDMVIPSESFGAQDRFPLEVEGDARAVLIVPAAQPQFPLEPITADPGLILKMPRSAWRDARYEIFRWDLFPQVLIFDISDYAFQDKMLRRLAFFVEKKGYRGKLLSDAELADKHGWNAHDYRAESLADFFNAVNNVNFPLNEEERELEKIISANGIIIKGVNGKWMPGEGAVVSISRESNAELRMRFMTHECYHGIFFADKAFRDFSAARYAALNAKAKSFLRSYFDYLAYDIKDNYLMVNEFMAYVLQQPVSQAADYFGKYAAEKIDESEWRRTVLPPKDETSGLWPLLAESFTREAEAFSAYVSERWGLAAGRIWRSRLLQN